MSEYRLSPSSLNLRKECPRCFWLAQHKVWKRPAGIFPSLPSGMDKILKVHFDSFIETGQLPPELREEEYCKGMNLFEDKDQLKIWRNHFKGITFRDEQGNELKGAVDNLLTKDNKLITLDYKTRGYPLKADTAEHYRQQSDIYNFLLRKNGHETEDYAFLLFYVPKEVGATGEFLFDTSLVKMETDVQRAEKVWKGAIQILNSDCPEGSCEWCAGK